MVYTLMRIVPNRKVLSKDIQMLYWVWFSWLVIVSMESQLALANGNAALKPSESPDAARPASADVTFAALTTHLLQTRHSGWRP